MKLSDIVVGTENVAFRSGGQIIWGTVTYVWFCDYFTIRDALRGYHFRVPKQDVLGIVMMPSEVTLVPLETENSHKLIPESLTAQRIPFPKPPPGPTNAYLTAGQTLNKAPDGSATQ